MSVVKYEVKKIDFPISFQVQFNNAVIVISFYNFILNCGYQFADVIVMHVLFYVETVK